MASSIRNSIFWKKNLSRVETRTRSWIKFWRKNSLQTRRFRCWRMSFKDTKKRWKMKFTCYWISKLRNQRPLTIWKPSWGLLRTTKSPWAIKWMCWLITSTPWKTTFPWWSRKLWTWTPRTIFWRTTFTTPSRFWETRRMPWSRAWICRQTWERACRRLKGGKGEDRGRWLS